MSVLRCSYVDTAAGQMHLRTLGEGPPLVLLHWAPATGAMYRHVMPPLVRRGLRCIAPDLPGYGRSADRPRPGWTMADYAANLAKALTALEIVSCDVLGGHLSAGIALELALGGRLAVRRVVLDGLALLTKAEADALMARFAHLSPVVRADGGHASFVWDSVVAFLKEWDPAFVVSETTRPIIFGYMRDLLDANRPPEPSPILGYDMASRLKLLRVPTLFLTAAREPLRVGHERGLALAPQAAGHVFPGSHPLHDPARAAEYAEVVAAFLAS